MADLKYADRVAESTVTTGTGDINLAGAIDSDHATFGSQFADGDLMPVSVFGGGKWMTFTGRYNSGANSLTRMTFRRSSTGSNLSLSGTMTVLCGWGADDAAAMVRTDITQSLTSTQKNQALSNVGGVGVDASQSLNAGQQSQGRANLAITGRNRVINGRFQRDQRRDGVATSTTDNVYWADRWRYLGEASAICGARQPNFGSSRYCGSIQISGTTNKGGFFEVTEGINCKDLQSKAVVLSATVAAAASINDVRMAILQFTGTEDATTGDPISTWNASGTLPTLASGWSYVNSPVNLNVTTTPTNFYVTGSVGASSNNLAAFIWSEDKNYTAGDGLYVSDVQLEEGVVPSPFEAVSAFQLNGMCARFYRENGQILFSGYAANVGLASFDFSGNPMRAVPVGLYTLAATNAITIPGVTQANILGLPSFAGTGDGGVLTISHSSASTGTGFLSNNTVGLEAEI